MALIQQCVDGLRACCKCLTICAAISGLLFMANCWSQESGQQSRRFATPNVSGADPFKTSELENVELPVALSGFSVVALHDSREWLMGSPNFQVVFDGQIYWFQNGREFEIFAAAPLEYAPVLGGDCIVTFAEEKHRQQGQLQHALLHDSRIYLFRDEAALRLFRDHPDRYMKSDLALGGNCIVSKYEDGRDVEGLPETTAVINGLRYQFLGDYQRRMFAAGMQRYGVQRRLLAPLKTAAPRQLSTKQEKAEVATETENNRTPRSNSELLQPSFMMDGYCPVTFREKKVWVRGSFQFKVEHNNRVYLMASSKEKARFESDPESYLPVLGGDCLVTLVDEGESLPGSARFAAIDEKSGKLYLFAGAEQLEQFRTNQSRYEEAAAAAGQRETAEGTAAETDQAASDQ